MFKKKWIKPNVCWLNHVIPNTFGKTGPLARQVHDEFVLEGPSDTAQEAGASPGSLWFLGGNKIGG